MALLCLARLFAFIVMQRYLGINPGRGLSVDLGVQDIVSRRIQHTDTVDRSDEKTCKEGEGAFCGSPLRPAAERAVAEHAPLGVGGEVVVHDRFAMSVPAALGVEHGGRHAGGSVKGGPWAREGGEGTSRWWLSEERSEKRGSLPAAFVNLSERFRDITSLAIL